MHWNALRSRLVRSTGVACLVGVLAATPAWGASAATDVSTIDSVATGTGWVTARIHLRGTVTRDGLAEVKVTYRCQLPSDNTGSNEVYRVLQQHPGTSRELWDDGYDVDEFSCDGSRWTVTHAFSTETGRFHPGWARLTLDIRVCTGDVTDDPGTCFSRVVEGWVWLRSVR